VARAARERSLGIMLAQLAATDEHLAAVASELAALLAGDEGADGLRSVADFGPKTTALLRAELGDVARFADSEQAVAYMGLDVRVWQSGKWRGRRKLSKRGSGRGRRVLYVAAVRSISRAGAAFGRYYRHLVGQGVAKMSA
jgi:transposase